MSTCIPTALPTSVAAVETTTTSSFSPTTLSLRRSLSTSFSNLRLFPQSIRTGPVAAKAKLNNASVGGSSSEAEPKLAAAAPEINNGKLSTESVPAQATEESISEFLTQVASLVKLVDSRDIVELQMKQLGCEVLIRKKEAITHASPVPMYMMQSPSQQSTPPSYAPAPVATPSASRVPAPSVPKPVKSSAPHLKSPMAGSFYRSPAPGAAPFVKVGDKVQKGQVVCIIEAMKLMNEIEADQSGTIVEVLAEDGKPVSLDTPLFAIQP